MSKQRELILTELQKVKSHPTVDELYTLVRKKMPRISLATVYRNLNQLAKKGMILKFEHAGQHARFDGETKKHYHFRCTHCGRLFDVLTKPIEVMETLMQEIKEHAVSDYHLEFLGYCKNCRKEMDHGENS